MQDNTNENNVNENSIEPQIHDENLDLQDEGAVSDDIEESIQINPSDTVEPQEMAEDDEVASDNNEVLVPEIQEDAEKSKYSSLVHIFNKIAPEKRLKVLISFSSVFLLILLIITDIIPILPNAYNRFYVGNTYSIGETQGATFEKCGKNIVYAGNGHVMVFGPDMSCKLKADSPSGVPMIETAQDNAIIYYKDTDDAVVILGNKHRSLDFKHRIISATISKNGYYGIAYEEPGYKSCVEIFNKNGTSVYKWHTNNYIMDLSVSVDGKKMVATSYETASMAVSSKLIFFDLSSDKPVKEVKLNSAIVSEVRFADNKTVVAFGDMYTLAYSDSGAKLWQIDYNGRVPKSYDVSDDGCIAYVFDRYSSSLSESSVEVYTRDGHIKGTYNSTNNVKHISFNNGYILLSLDRQTVLLDDDGDVVKTKNTEKDFKQAVLYHNYNFAFSITDGVGEIMSVKH